jgi:hypothetical protein
VEAIPTPWPVAILWYLGLATGVLTLVAFFVGVVRAVWRRDWRWLRASGVLFLLTVALLVPAIAIVSWLVRRA